MNPNANKMNVNIDLSKSIPVVCESTECGGELFMSAMKFRKLPKLLIGTPEDQLVPIQVFVCMKCGEVPSMFDLSM